MNGRTAFRADATQPTPRAASAGRVQYARNWSEKRASRCTKAVASAGMRLIAPP